MGTIYFWLFIIIFVFILYALNRFLYKKFGTPGSAILYVIILSLYILEKTDYGIGKKIGYYLKETISKPIPKPRPKDKWSKINIKSFIWLSTKGLKMTKILFSVRKQSVTVE